MLQVLLRRRSLFCGVAALALQAPRARSEQRLRVAVLLAVGPSAEYTASLAAFEQAMAERGWRKGNTVEIDAYWSTGNLQRRQEAIAAILAAPPDVVLAQSEAVTTSVMQVRATFPVVFVHVADPVGSGLVNGLARPEGRLTGFTDTTPTLVAKWIQLLREAAPMVSRVAMLFNPETAAQGGAVFRDPFLAAGRTLGISTSPAEVRSTSDIEAALTSLAASPGGGLVTIPDPFIAGNSAKVVELAKRLRLPAIYPYRYYAAQGGLMSYGVDNVDLFRQSADYVDRLLRGATPADLPVQQPTRFRMTFNARTARDLELHPSPSFLAQAAEVIDGK